MTTNVLRIISSPRSQASISRQLGQAIVEKIRIKYPDAQVQEWDLAKVAFPHLQEGPIQLFFTPAQDLTAEQAKTLETSNQAIASLQAADIVVIDAPMYNYTISSYLKAFIDHVVRYGVTFQPSTYGVEGLLKNKKVYIAVSSGFVYTDGGAFADFDFLTPYLTKMLAWIGLTDTTFYRAEGVNIPLVQDTALQKAIDSIVID